MAGAASDEPASQGESGVIPSAAAWEALSQRIRPFIRSRVDSDADADDVLQDVLLRMHRGLAKLKDDRRLRAWMFSIARGAIADHGRARKRHPLQRSDEEADRAEAESGWDPVAADADAMGAQADQILGASVGYFVSQLPSPYREAITLTELEGVSQVAAARMLGVSVSGMKSRVQRGRAKLRALLEECCEIAVDSRGNRLSCEARTDWVPQGAALPCQGGRCGDGP